MASTPTAIGFSRLSKAWQGFLAQFAEPGDEIVVTYLVDAYARGKGHARDGALGPI